MPDEIQEIDYGDTLPKEDPLQGTGVEDVKYRSKRHYFIPSETGAKITATATRAKEIAGAGVTKARGVTTSTLRAVGSGTVKAAQALKNYQDKQKLKRELLTAQARGYGYAPRRARRTRDRIAYVNGQPVIVRGGQIGGQAPVQPQGTGMPNITAGMGGRMAPDITSGIAGSGAPQITDLGASSAPSILGGMGGKSGILESLQARGGSSGLMSIGKGSGLFAMPKGGILSGLTNLKKRRH